MDLGLTDKLVLISGSTEGIGLEIARVFYQQGARVILNGRSAQKLEAAIENIQSSGLISKNQTNSTSISTSTSSNDDNKDTADANKKAKVGNKVFGIRADLSNADETAALIAQVEQLGELDVLVNNVGIFETKEFEKVTDEEWMHYFNVNVLGHVRLSRHFLPKMLARNSGRVLVIASEAGARPIKEMIHYSVTKGALITLARGLAELTKGTKVTVNSVLAGPTWTEGVEKYVEGLAESKQNKVEDEVANYFKTHETTSLLQRFCTVQEIADVVVFLASERASAINGTSQRVEGGIIRHV